MGVADEIPYALDVAGDIAECECRLDHRDARHDATSSRAGSRLNLGDDFGRGCGPRRTGMLGARDLFGRAEVSRSQLGADRKLGAQFGDGTCQRFASRSFAPPERCGQRASESGDGRDLLRRASTPEEVSYVGRLVRPASRTSSQMTADWRSTRVSELAK